MLFLDGHMRMNEYTYGKLFFFTAAEFVRFKSGFIRELELTEIARKRWQLGVTENGLPAS